MLTAHGLWLEGKSGAERAYLARMSVICWYCFPFDPKEVVVDEILEMGKNDSWS